MDIIEEVEKTCLSLERKGKTKEAETLRYDTASILCKAKPPSSNLTADQKKGLSYLKKNKEKIAVVPFDKGEGFVSIKRPKLEEKAEKEFNNVKCDTKDTTASLQTKIQCKLRDLEKKGKFDKDTYKKLYPSTALTPTASPSIKAHKPSKDCPARLITSHIGAPQENLASHLNDLLKPFIVNNSYVCKNSTEFVEKTKNVKVGQYEKMVSFDATALFPSVPIGDATTLIHDKLKNDPNLHRRTKLDPQEIVDLISLCLSSSNFIYNARHHSQEDSGPIGLSLMVTISQIWMIDTMEKAIKEAKHRGTAVPCLLFIYMDDCWTLMPYCRPGLCSSTAIQCDPAADFNDCLNSIHPRVQFTREEEEERSIAFLDVYVTRQENGSLLTRIYRKPSNTNVTIKPQSCQHPNTVSGIFKSELCRAYRLCSTPEQTKNEIQHIINIFNDNGHDRNMLQKLADTYKPSKCKKQKNNNKQDKQKQNNNSETEIPENLFEVLPFSDTDLSENEYKPYVEMTYLPDSVYHQMRRACDKAGVKLITKPGTKLKDMLCSANKTRHDPSHKPGEYKLSCPCSPNATYIGQTIWTIQMRGKEHRTATEKGNWSHSGICQHKENCHSNVNWEPEVIVNMSNKNKRKLTYNLKVREALEIRCHNCGPGKGLNEDFGAYVRTTQWNPVFHEMDTG